MEAVSNMYLTSVTAGTTSLTINFYAYDPYSIYGVICFDIVDVTDPDNVVKTVYADPSETSITVSDLDPDTTYSIKMYYVDDLDEVVQRDFMRATTSDENASMTITAITENTVTFTLYLDEDVNYKSATVTLYDVSGSANFVVGELTVSGSSNLKAAKSDDGLSGLTVTIDTSNASQITTFQGSLVALGLNVVYTNGTESSSEIAWVRTANPYESEASTAVTTSLVEELISTVNELQARITALEGNASADAGSTSSDDSGSSSSNESSGSSGSSAASTTSSGSSAAATGSSESSASTGNSTESAAEGTDSGSESSGSESEESAGSSADGDASSETNTSGSGKNLE
ncbi:MAG: hypothetical protein LIO67_05190 [Lachnospiraceae bacterium]|nr:hypothetical protein [Lachnospiraceae bacterium]